MKLRMSMLLCGAALLASGPALAVPEYPAAIAGHLGLGYEVPCSLCHDQGKTGSGTVITPFGWSMRGEGLTGEDEATVTKALDALKAKKTDSDGDGTGDVAELVAGTDPNSAASVPIPNGEQPGYGCGGTAPNGHSGAMIVPLPLLVVAARALRRRWRKDR